MRTTDVIAVLAFIVIGLTAINFLTATKEGFESGRLSPDVVEQGPAHLLKADIEMTRPFNVIGTLTQQKCYEQDGHTVIEKVGDYAQRTNNYMRTYPDSCSAPFKELVGSFYAPRDGSIGAPIPVGSPAPASTQCA